MQREETTSNGSSIKGSAVSRRDVVKTTAVASVAALASTLGTNWAHAAGSDVIKVGLIGCGGRGTGAAADCLKGAEMAGAKAQIVACGDVFANQTRGIRDRYKVEQSKVFAGLDNYKGVVDSGVDLVLMATPPGFRPRHFQYAIEKGKHVFFEKPVGVDPVGCRMVMEASKLAAEKKLAVVAGTQRRHESNYIDTIKAIHDGAIGEILHMSVYWNGGGIWSRGRQPGMSDTEYQIHNWYHYVWLSGDQICEQHIHNIDVANWVLNGHPVSAYAMGGRQVRRNTPGQIWDHFAVEYEYANGARVLSFCRHWGQSDDNVSEFAIGSNGVANPGGWIQPKGQRRTSFQGRGSGYQLEHRDLIRSILDGKPLNEGQQVAESTMTAVMGRISAYTGRKIYWDRAAANNNPRAATMMDSKLDTFPANLDLKGPMPEPEVPMPDKEEPI